MAEIDHLVVDAFIESARETLSTMAMMDLDVEGVTESLGLQEPYEILTTIGLSGSSEGLLGIGIGNKFAGEFVAAMLGMEADELSTEDLADGVGELANMVAGGAKAALAESDWKFDLALPIVMQDANQNFHFHASAGSWVRTRVGDAEVSLYLWMGSGSR